MAGDAGALSGKWPVHSDVKAWQEEIPNYFEAGRTSGPGEGIDNKARVIIKRAYRLRSADSLWNRLDPGFELGEGHGAAHDRADPGTGGRLPGYFLGRLRLTTEEPFISVPSMRRPLSMNGSKPGKLLGTPLVVYVVMAQNSRRDI
jgi:hypothetical protein